MISQLWYKFNSKFLTKLPNKLNATDAMYPSENSLRTNLNQVEVSFNIGEFTEAIARIRGGKRQQFIKELLRFQ